MDGGSSFDSSLCSSARLVSSSPPESFASSHRLPLEAARAWSRSPRHYEAAVLTVSCESAARGDARTPPPAITPNTTAGASRVSNSSRDVWGENELPLAAPCTSAQPQRSSVRSGVVARLLVVSLLVLGGLVVPVMWAALLNPDYATATVKRHCRNICTSLQFAFIAQGLALSLSGALIAVCWVDDEARSPEPHKRLVLLSVAMVVGFAAVLAGLCLIVWNIMSSASHCHWTWRVYAALVPLELTISLTSAASTGIISVFTFYRKNSR